jgi:hypothetical protein
MSTCGARPGEKIRSLASLAAATIEAIRVGVRTISGALAAGAAGPGIDGGAWIDDGANDGAELVAAGGSSGLVVGLGDMRVGASIRKSSANIPKRQQAVRKYEYEPEATKRGRNGGGVSSNDKHGWS